MIVDVASVAARTLMLCAMLQACGIVLFLGAFGGRLSSSRARLLRTGVLSTAVALASLVCFYVLEAGRMAGEFAGVLDLELLGMVAESGAVPAVVRVLGLSAVLFGFVTGHVRVYGIPGAVLVALSFALTGHTVEAAPRASAGALVALHVLLAAAWLGALPSLYALSRSEPPRAVADVVARFSAVAAWTVPPIALAGLALAWQLGLRASSLGQPYAQLLLAKALTFAALMLLAALNKWRYGPRLASGAPDAGRKFRRTVIVEYVLITGVLALTATLTTFHSPSG